MSLLLRDALSGSTLVVAIDPGKAWNRVWVSTGEAGLVAQPCSLPTTRQGVEELDRLVRAHQGPGEPVLVVEATGGLHQAWVSELERRFPGRVRLAAPSETTSARTQLGSRRFKTDDRDCAALTYLARQGQGRPAPSAGVEALRAAGRHRRGLVAERKVAQQRLHDQLNALCPGLSAPPGHGRALGIESVIGQAMAGLRRRVRRPPTEDPVAARGARGRWIKPRRDGKRLQLPSGAQPPTHSRPPRANLS